MLYDQEMHYSIMDPTGNITALVESCAEPGKQPAAAAEIMARHPDVEQVGFVSVEGAGEDKGGSQISLRMAGGEFCGNASMSAAALYLIKHHTGYSEDPVGKIYNVTLNVSGVAEPVLVRMRKDGSGSFTAGVHMPPARFIEHRSFTYNEMTGLLPIVMMEGISHIIIEEESPFFCLAADHQAAEEAVRRWAGELEEDGLGLIFVSRTRQMIPLVYIPVSNTMVWEKSCASGTAALGMCLADRIFGPVDETFAEPGGSLRVMSDPLNGNTWLFGSVKCLESF